MNGPHQGDAIPPDTEGAGQPGGHRLRLRRLLTSLRPYMVGVALVALAWAAAEGVHNMTGGRELATIFVTAVLLVAFLHGAPPAYFTAALAFAVYNVFINGPHFIQGWSAGELADLMAFFAVAMLTGNLTGRVRDQARGAQARAQATTALFDATREFSASDDECFIRQRLAHHLSIAARGAAVVAPPDSPDLAELAGSGPVGAAGPPSFPSERPDGEIASVEVDGATFRPLYANSQLVGVAGWRAPPDRGFSVEEHALLGILSDVGATAVARARLAADKADAEAMARTEDLRNALLSSISHDLRTPLATILASASSLDQFGEQFDAATRRDLAKAIQEEAERLEDYVANLLNMSKLESGVLTPRREAFGVLEVVERTVKRRSAASGRTIEVVCDAELKAFADPVLFEQALGNVVENALKYSPPGSRVEVACEAAGEEILIRVSDEGPGVSSSELVMLFVKFYRTAGAEKTRGTGLGLSITKGLIEGMGGKVAAFNREPPHTGLVVTMTLPAARDA